jgi:hypothetical protein
VLGLLVTGPPCQSAPTVRIGDDPDSDPGPPVWDHGPDPSSILREETTMSKRGRKRRSRKGNGANHGKRPNA